MLLPSILLVRQKAVLALLRVHPLRMGSALQLDVRFLLSGVVLDRLLSRMRAHLRHRQPCLLLRVLA